MQKWGGTTTHTETNQLKNPPNITPTHCLELFTWATGRLISKDEAMACARRQPGRSWEAVTEKLYTLGVHCWNWPVPLTLQGCRNAAKTAPPATPAQQLTRELLANVGKRSSSGVSGSATVNAAIAAATANVVAAANGAGSSAGGDAAPALAAAAAEDDDRHAPAFADGAPRRASKRVRGSSDAPGVGDLAKLSELQLWSVIVSALQLASQKRASSTGESDTRVTTDISNLRDLARTLLLQSDGGPVQVTPIDLNTLASLQQQQQQQLQQLLAAQQGGDGAGMPLTLQPLLPGAALQALTGLPSPGGANPLGVAAPFLGLQPAAANGGGAHSGSSSGGGGGGGSGSSGGSGGSSGGAAGAPGANAAAAAAAKMAGGAGCAMDVDAPAATGSGQSVHSGPLMAAGLLTQPGNIVLPLGGFGALAAAGRPQNAA